jgi:F-type H+-transporting ATPase subunit epsilon
VPLQVEVVAADRKVWSGEASMVVARTVEGEFGVLPGHAPVLAVLAEGDVRVTPVSGETVTATLSGGFVSVEHDRVTIVSDVAVVAGTQAR